MKPISELGYEEARDELVEVVRHWSRAAWTWMRR